METHARQLERYRWRHHSIAHLQLVDPKDFLRFKDLGVIADFQLLWAKREPANEKPLEPYLGAERLVNRQERAASGTGTRKRAGADGILCVSTDDTEISNQLSGELGRYAGSGLLDKDALSDQELYDMVVLAVFGGVDTTRNQLGLAISLFVENPDQWRLLADRPELARNAVEEVMRMRPTTTWVTREAMEDFTYNDLEFKRGTTIHLFSESAGTDPREFAQGFDIAAQRKPHFGFGGGVHHCLGHFIARADMTEALKVLARRMRNPRLDGEPTWLPDSGNTGPVKLPIAFDRKPECLCCSRQPRRTVLNRLR